MRSFLGGKSRGAFGQPRFSWRENRMTIVAFFKKYKIGRFYARDVNIV